MKFPVPITEEEIARASDVAALANEMRAAYASGGSAAAEVPPRALVIHESPFAAFVAMPAVSVEQRLFVTKVGTIVPKPDSPGKTAQSLVVVFSTESGALLAILDGTAITKLKCAAVSALVADICAAPGARTLAIIGSGVQAREQIRGVGAVRQLLDIRVYSRDPERVQEFLRGCADIAGGARLTACASAAEAAESADIVSTTTTSTQPVLEAAALQTAGLHVNCMGAHTSRSRELPREVLRQSALVVEDRATAVLELGEPHERAIQLAELVSADPASLRSQRTVFSSTGHAFLDVLACAHVLSRLGLVARRPGWPTTSPM
jgi:ornithine cyclodeaminase/alanine dehydrogenase-like protein (mu-crystallin family)